MYMSEWCCADPYSILQKPCSARSSNWLKSTMIWRTMLADQISALLGFRRDLRALTLLPFSIPHLGGRPSPPHYMLTRQPRVHRPRTFIAKILNYRDCNAILRLTRDHGNTPFPNGRISVFPDFSAEVQKQRSHFVDVKWRLRIHHLKYCCSHPISA